MALRPYAVIVVVAVTVLLSSSGCAPAPINKPLKVGSVDEGPGSLTAARKYLEGRWQLEAFEVHPPGKAPVTLKGSGLLTYDDFGNLTIEIRADKTSTDFLRAAGIAMSDDGVISTSGRTAVDIPNRTLTYFIQGQPTADTGPLAMSRPRHWEVAGDLLTMTTQDETGQALSIGRWRKLP